MRELGSWRANASPGDVLAATGVLLVACLFAACATRAPQPTAPVLPPAAPPAPAVPTVTRGEFNIAASKLDTWNAVGQIIVRTPDAIYEGRAQMLDLYSVNYRGQSFLLITRALLLSDTIKQTTTLVTARTPDGKPIDSDASAALLALLQRELPAQIEQDRATQAAEAAAKKAKAKDKKKAKAGSHKK